MNTGNTIQRITMTNEQYDKITADINAAEARAIAWKNADEATRKKILNDAHAITTDAETDSRPVETIEERLTATFEDAIVDAISFVSGTADCQLSTTETERHSIIISALKNIVERNEENAACNL